MSDTTTVENADKPEAQVVTYTFPNNVPPSQGLVPGGTGGPANDGFNYPPSQGLAKTGAYG